MELLFVFIIHLFVSFYMTYLMVFRSRVCVEILSSAISGHSLVLMLFHYRDLPPLPSYQHLYILHCTVMLFEHL